MVRHAVIAALCLLGPRGVAQAQPGGTAADLVGSWRFESYEDRDDRGTVVRPYGAAPAGLLIYDATGHMAVQIMKTPPPDVVSDDWDNFTAPEKVALWDGYVAYFGRYEVDIARSVVTHLAEADLSRLYIGRREERRFALDGDRLTLSETWTQSGRTWSGVRVLTRRRGAAQTTPTTTPPPTNPPAGAAAAVLARVNALFATFEAGDAAAMSRLVYPDGRVTAAGKREDGAANLRQQSWTQFAERVTPERRFQERIADPVVNIDGDIAMVWAPFVVRVGGKVSNCGVDHFDLVREQGDWKVMNLTFSSRSTGCPEQ